MESPDVPRKRAFNVLPTNSHGLIEGITHRIVHWTFAILRKYYNGTIVTGRFPEGTDVSTTDNDGCLSFIGEIGESRTSGN